MELEPRIAEYLARQIPGASDVEVRDLFRISGGASRETYRLRLHYTQDGTAHERGLILRRDPPGSLIETDRRAEFEAYRAFHGTDVPVPEPLWLEEGSEALDHPFFVMEQIEGCEASPQALTLPPYAEHTAALAEQKWSILARIAQADPEALGLTATLEGVEPERCWQRELAYWEGVIDEDAFGPEPIVRAAIRWMKRNPPPPPEKVGVVHGDYRTGNFLFDGEGKIRGILDWEMVHLGDPLEDLAWGLNRVWCWARDGRVGGLIEKADAIAIYERASGTKVDPEALRWWELFSSVKGQAIWISSGREYVDGPNKDPILALSGWFLLNSQDRALLETLGKLEVSA